MKNAPDVPQTDEEAEAEAAQARRQGTELIENHLSHHLSENPDSSYVTWIATLHPENADVRIDERFFVSDNPWWTVYEGAKNDIPIATAVPFNEQEDTPTSTCVTAKPFDSDSAPASSTEHKTRSSCNPIDSFVGFVLALAASLTVFALEFAAFVVYSVAAGFYNLAKAMDYQTNIFTGLFYNLWMLIYWILAIVDSSLLLASVLTTEVVAGICYILSSLFAGCDKAAIWHQYIRRTCHMMRWAFRSRSLYPSRHVFGCVSKEDGDTVEELGERADEDVKELKYDESTSAVVVVDAKDVVIAEVTEDGGAYEKT